MEGISDGAGREVNMDIYKVLKWAEKVELKMSRLYAAFSDVFARDEEHYGFLKQFAEKHGIALA